jgi:hypothetical protein
VFSGRPDPTWPIDEETAARLEDIWRQLEPWEGEIPEAPVLGYRGSFVRLRDGREWDAYGGAVTLLQPAPPESRSDRNGGFERQVLDSAPQGVLPPVD